MSKKIKALDIGTYFYLKNNNIKIVDSKLYRISYSLAPKIETCLKYFSDENTQKQPLCFGRELKEQGVKTNPVD
jgi:hypothetical protein